MCLCALSSTTNLLCLRESFLHMFCVFRNRFLVFYFVVNICELSKHILCHQVRCRSVFYCSAGVKANFKYKNLKTAYVLYLKLALTPVEQ